MRRAAAHASVRLEGAPPLVPVLDRYRCNGRLAVLLYEEEPEEGDDGLWCDLTVNLPQHGLPGDDWAFVPAERLPYARPRGGGPRGGRRPRDLRRLRAGRPRRSLRCEPPRAGA